MERKEGDYVVSATNTSGEKLSKIKVVILDKPNFPESLKISKENIGWNAPALDGGAAITNYIVEKRETSRPTWVMVSSSVMTTDFTFFKVPQRNAATSQHCNGLLRRPQVQGTKLKNK